MLDVIKAPAPYSVEATNCVSQTLGPPTLRQGWRRVSCVAEGFSLADPKRGISVHENLQNYGITKERFSGFVPTNFVTDCGIIEILPLTSIYQ